MNNSDIRSNAFSAKKLEYFQLRLKQKGISVAGEQAISRRKMADPCPLSFAQQRLWFLEQFEPGTPTYNIPSALRLRGTLDLSVLEQSIHEIIRRHESLRTVFAHAEDGPVQIITPAHFLLTRTNLQSLSEGERESEARRLADEEAKRPFDLSSGPLIRWHLLVLDTEEYVLLFTIHHIISDGWSIAILIREMTTLYMAFRAGQPSPLPPLPIQYADYSLWQRQWLHGLVLEEQVSYWQSHLRDLPTLSLPTDHPRPPVQSYRGATVAFTLSESLTGQLAQLSQQQGTTLFMTLLAAFQVLLARYSGQQDLAVGTPIANRRHRELEGLIGFFVNTLVLRTDLSGAPSFAQVLQRVREGCLGAYAHQDLPFERLVELLQPTRTLNRHPLFQVLFGFQPALPNAQAMVELQIEPLAVEMGTTKFDLSLLLQEQGANHKLIGTFEYNIELFERETIQRLSEHFKRLLESIVAHVDSPIQMLPMLSDAEQEQLIHSWNATRAAYPVAMGLHRLVEEQVARTPDAVAVIFGDHLLTYAALDARANQLAHLLQSRGLGPEELVGVCLNRCLELVICLLAILKAGGAYVPLDPSYPHDRLRFMLQDAGLRLILASEVPVWMSPEQGQCLAPARAWQTDEFSTTAPQCTIDPTQLAYVIYTSGSTGRPKAAMNQHGSICNRLQWMQEAYPLTPTDRVLQKTPMSFDVSVWEFFWPLCSGACLVVAPPGAHQDPRSLIHLLVQHDITILHFVPAMLRAFLDTPGAGNCGALMHVICSGEALPSDLQDRFFTLYKTQLHNLYGPTEAAIDVTAWTCVPDWKKPSVPIGRPIANTQIYLLSPALQPVPPGAVGELYIGGLGLARGYWQRPDLTAERFLPDPFSDAPGARLYRTGDLARYLADSSLEFVGRADDQIKLRGYRIELGEIEAVLRAQPGIAEAVVFLRDSSATDPHLVACIVPGPSQDGVAHSSLSLRELRGRLSQWLPTYMLPTHLEHLEHLPLTPSGKVDRRALSVPDQTPASGRERAYVAPRSPLEEILVGLWQEVLGVEQIGIEDNFFELGGHSLLATQLVSRLRSVLRREVPLRLIFAHSTIAELAVALEPILQGKSEGLDLLIPPLIPQKKPATIPLSFAQERLWFLAQLVPDNPFYNIPLALRLRGELQEFAFNKSIRELAARHEVLRTTFPSLQGVPSQSLAVSLSIDLPVIDLQGLSEAERKGQVQHLGTQEALRPFDLTNTPPFRVALLRVTPQEHVILLTLHHIIADGWSLQVLAADLSALYTAFRAGQPSPLPPLPIQYADYSLWQRQWLHGPVLEEQVSYWQSHLRDLPTLSLPTDHPRPPVQSYRGATVAFTLSESLTGQLAHLSQQQGTTLFMTLLAAFQVLLARYSGQQDLAVGTPIANRRHRELEGLIGFFVNTLVLRTDLSGAPSFAQVLQRVREGCLGAYAHQDLPFERLVELLQPTRALNRHPLFQVSFQLLQSQQRSDLHLSLPQLDLIAESIEGRVARFDLEFDLYESHRRIEGNLLYNTDLFEQATITRLLQHWQTLLEAIAVNPEQHIWQIPLLTASEEEQILSTWNQTRMAVPQDQCLHQLVEAQVARTPDAVAVIYEESQLTYAALNARANQLTHYLRGLGVGPEVLVGVCLDRSPELVIGLLAILKAGGAYVPLDPAYPQERLAFVIQDACMPVLLTQKRLLAKFPKKEARMICLDSDWKFISNQQTGTPDNSASPANLAYVIYTSGSTGKPKSVMVPHRGLVNYLQWCINAYIPAEGRGSIVHSSIGFDLTVTSLFSPLLAGQSVKLLPGAEGIKLLAAALSSDENLSFIKLTPTHLDLLNQLLPAESVAGRVRALIIGGEALSQEQLSFWRTYGSEARLINEYGPTEAVVGCCVYEVPAGAPWSGTVPIGHPISNARMYVLDQQMQPVPIGVVGEIYIGGAGLARGYGRRPELTAERFLPDPFSGMAGDRLYRTGDLARYLSDGNLEFLGRVDSQVKLRGYRIELGEIEAALRAQPGIAEAVVLLREDHAADSYLAAYIVPDQSRQSAPSASEQTPQLSPWQTVFEETHRQAQPSQVQDPTFNIAGWLSSYTRQPLSYEEMGEWVEQTVARIASLQAQRVLEIGCGTGLLLFRLAPEVETYWATDFSSYAIQGLQAQLEQQAHSLPQVRLEQRTADNWTDLPRAFFDLVVLNSVVQYFPDLDYLLSVLEQAVQGLREGGCIFVGDVRSLPLLETFHTSVVLYQASDTLSVEQVRELVRQRMQQEDELVIDPRFFSWLPRRLPQIRRVHLSPRRGRAENELTRYRYDVILEIAASQASDTGAAPSTLGEGTDTPGGIVWQEISSLQRVAQVLSEQPQQLGLAHVRNRRVQSAVRACEILRAADPEQRLLDVWPETAQSEAGETEIDPEELWALGQSLGYQVEISWLRHDQAGAYDVLFRRETGQVEQKPVAGQQLRQWSFPQDADLPLSWADYATKPWQMQALRTLVPRLRQRLEEQLPAYMLPATFVLLDHLPLTPNGKLDRRALPSPTPDRMARTKEYVAPRDPQEELLAGLWQEVLGVERVGIKDNFFELGGHSLMAVRVVARARHAGLPLTLSLLFQYPILADIAARIKEDLLSQPANEPGVHTLVSTRSRTEKQAEQKHKALVGLQHPGTGRPLFCIPPISGEPMCYAALAQALDYPCYGLRAAGLQGEREPFTSIEEIAAYYIEAIRTLDPSGPYALGGWSFGGLVAFEMALQLQRQGAGIALLALIDTFAPPFNLQGLTQEEAAQISGFLTENLLQCLDYLPEQERIQPLQMQTLRGLPRLEQVRYLQELAELAGVGEFIRVGHANFLAMEQYRPQGLYEGRLLLLQASTQTQNNSLDATYGWEQLTSLPVEVQVVPGTHATLVSEPYVSILAQRLRLYLDR